MITVAGIDPGKSGSLSWVGPRATYFSTPMPESITAIWSVLSGFKVDHVFLEKAQTMPKNGVVPSFNYGHHNGSIEGILTALRIPYTLVKPQVWMKALHVGADSKLDTKGKSVQVCQRLFPGVDLCPGKRQKPHDGMAEALLIAEYGRRVLQGEGHG